MEHNKAPPEHHSKPRHISPDTEFLSLLSQEAPDVLMIVHVQHWQPNLHPKCTHMFYQKVPKSEWADIPFKHIYHIPFKYQQSVLQVDGILLFGKVPGKFLM